MNGVRHGNVASGIAGDARALALALVTPALCCVVAFVLAPILCIGIYSFWTRLASANG